MATIAITLLLRLNDVEAIAPAGEFQAFVAERYLRFCCASVSRVKSAHWPVKRVTGRDYKI